MMIDEDENKSEAEITDNFPDFVSRKIIKNPDDEKTEAKEASLIPLTKANIKPNLSLSLKIMKKNLMQALMFSNTLQLILC